MDGAARALVARAKVACLDRGADRRAGRPHGGAAQPHRRDRAAGDDRDRGSPLLTRGRDRLDRRAARRSRRRHVGASRAGRFDAHAAARPKSLPRRRADRVTQAPGGLPRRPARTPLVEEARPRVLSQHRVLRPAGVRDPGRSADVLFNAGAEPDAAAGSAAGGAAPGPDTVRPAPEPGVGARTAS